VTRRRYFRLGVFAACGIVACLGILFLVCVVFSYDGKCGGFFPGLSVRKQCTFWEFLSGDMLVFAMAVGVTYWPGILALLLLPPAVGYCFDRRR
jgi:hypothetical protein